MSVDDVAAPDVGELETMPSQQRRGAGAFPFQPPRDHDLELEARSGRHRQQYAQQGVDILDQIDQDQYARPPRRERASHRRGGLAYWS